MSRHYMKLNASGRHGSPQSEQTWFGNITAMVRRFLPSVAFLILCSACSSVPSEITMPPPNLARSCPALPEPARLDPDRLIWELDLIAKYQDCATRHRLTIEAWRALDKKTPNE